MKSRMVRNGFLGLDKYADRHVLAILSGNIVDNEENIGNNPPYFFINSHDKYISTDKTMVFSKETGVNSEEIGNYTSLHGNNLIK